MGSACVYEDKIVIHELTQGIQMAKQLSVNLHSPEARNFLIQKILSSYETALFVLKSGISAGQPPAPALPPLGLPESVISIESPGSEEFEFDQLSSAQHGQNVTSKKRKHSATCENQVRIWLENNTDDGYNWRKYGEKDISGAKFPRSYYKCSYRKVQKCLATKQVQRKDENPTVFEIAYKGKHTCNLGAHSAGPPPAPLSPENHDIKPTHQQQQLSPLTPGEKLLNLRATLSVDTSDSAGDMIPSSFSFPSTSSGLMEDDIHDFQFPNLYDDDIWQVHSPQFISPATSASNLFTEWGSSSSLYFLAGPDDAEPDFEFMNILF